MQDFVIPHKTTSLRANKQVQSTSEQKIIFRMKKLISGLKIDFENWKWPIFKRPLHSSYLTRYLKKSLKEAYLNAKIFFTMKIHNCHPTRDHPEENWVVVEEGNKSRMDFIFAGKWWWTPCWLTTLFKGKITLGVFILVT